MPIELDRRRIPAVLPSADETPAVGVRPATETRTSATTWAERNDETPGVRDQLRRRTQVKGAADRIGATEDGRELDRRIDGGPRTPTIGAKHRGVTYRPGIDSQDPTDPPEHLTTWMLQDVDTFPDANRFVIGDRTYTAGELARENTKNPTRFEDFLRANGIDRAEFNELLDDISADPPPPGTVYDLNPGSALARTYRLGGADGAAIDQHLDVRRTERAAEGNVALVDRLDVSAEDVEGPGFFQRVGEAIAEAIAWLGRLFGASWNPDTVTFDGRVDDEHFHQLGRTMAAGDNSYAVQALLRMPGGEAAVRAELMSRKPELATDEQWARAVDGIIVGLGSPPEAELPENLSPLQDQQILVYLRSRDFSAEGQADVATVLAQPPAVRDAALGLLVSLPETERNNMLTLLSPPSSPFGLGDPELVRVYHESAADRQTALFAVMQGDGFRRDVGSPQADRLAETIEGADQLQPELHTEYFNTLRAIGMDRLGLVTAPNNGLLARVDPGRVSPERAAEVFGRFVQNAGNSVDASTYLASTQFTLPSTVAERTLASRADQRAVRSALEGNNVDLLVDGTALDIDRYFSDSTYRRTIFTALSGESAPSTRELVEQRARFDRMLRNVAAGVDLGAVPSNIQVDVSSGNPLFDTYGLGGQVPSGAVETEVITTSTLATTSPTELITDAQLGGVAGNNWFQYGIFEIGVGSFASREAFTSSRNAFRAAGSVPDPAHPLAAMYGLDDFGDAHNTSSGWLREDGIAHGQPAEFTAGGTATGEDFQVLAFVGRGMGGAGANDARRVTRMFTEHGGVPTNQVEAHFDPSSDEVFGAVRAELLRDPREGDARDRPRTVVAYYSGHTASARDNTVTGFHLSDGSGGVEYFTPTQMSELNRLAQERGVNLVWWTDACRSGEYVHVARDEEVAAASAAGTLDSTADAIVQLRAALTEQHVVLSDLHHRSPANMPSATDLAAMGSAALRGGRNSDAYRALVAERDRVLADASIPFDDQIQVEIYLDAISTTLDQRDVLAGTDVDPALLDHGLIDGDTTWRPGRYFSTYTMGEVGDLLGAELRDRL